MTQTFLNSRGSCAEVVRLTLEVEEASAVAVEISKYPITITGAVIYSLMMFYASIGGKRQLLEDLSGGVSSRQPSLSLGDYIFII